MTHHLFVYGSLLSSRSRRQTLGVDCPLTPASVKGFQRVWNLHAPQLGGGISFLGLEPAPAAQCNGAILQLDEEAFRKISAREKHYTLTELPATAVTAADDAARQSVVTFTNHSPLRPTETFPIVQSYLDLCLEGLIELSSDSADAEARCMSFLQETSGWSRHWINDRVHARRPQVEYPPAAIIDRAIMRGLPYYLDHIRIGG